MPFAGSSSGRPTTVLVISDLHLGGDVGFQMCSPDGQQRLAEFLAWAATQRKTNEDLRLVLAGDVVDFLAESNADGTWSAFTSDERAADEKLANIMARTQPVWRTLRDLTSDGVTVTILLGNHDVEISLPAPRRRIVSAIAPRGGLEMLYDGEAFRLGELLVEHGNRYEGWNAVLHDSLRKVRSRLSRGAPPGEFPAQPGSELVARVMNPIKRKFGFIDLLKPETSGAIPILAVLDPGAWRSSAQFIRQAAAAAWRQLQFDLTGMPVPVVGDRDLESVETGAVPMPDSDALDLADALAAQGSAAVSAEESAIGDVAHRIEVGLLLKAFRKRVEKDGETFQVDKESDLYLKPARVLASQGARTVVFGHTHHAKRIALDGGATYLNTGTWADLMRIPEAVYTGSESEARKALETFLGDLEANRLDALRRRVPTFARVALDANGRVEDSNVLFFDGPGSVEPISTRGVFGRLGFEAGANVAVVESAQASVDQSESLGGRRHARQNATSPVALVIHTQQDGQFVEKELVPLLPCNGFGRWISLSEGSPVPVEVAARAAHVVLVPVSTLAARSRDIGDKAAAVARCRVPVVPVVLDGTAPRTIATDLECYPTVDFTGAQTDASRMVEARRALAGLLPPVPDPDGSTGMGEPWIQSVPWNDAAFSAEVREAVRRRDGFRIDHLVESFERYVRSFGFLDGVVDTGGTLGALRSRRAFHSMLRYADAAIQAGRGSAEVKRQRGQALIELGEFQRAVESLEAIVADRFAPTKEQAEARGLLGRAFKQQYVDHPHDAGAAALLDRAIAAYGGVYGSDSSQTWHGINLASCLLRSSRDGGGPADERRAAEVAAAVLETLAVLQSRDRSLSLWDLATRFEALVVLGRKEDAADALDRYLAHPGLTAFEVSSTHRQMVEVLQVDGSDWGAELVNRLARAVERYRTGGAAVLTRTSGDTSVARPARALLIRTTDPSWVPRDVPGLVVTAQLGTIISALGDDGSVRALLREGRVVTVEESRPGGMEECANSVPFIGAAAVQEAPSGERGSQALIAIIDEGIDVLHEALLDADGKSRIEEIWDQRDPGGPPPAGCTFGTVHARGKIGQYVATKTVPSTLGRNIHGHGTHVASIAAGRRAGSFAGGVAPEARLLVVISSADQPIGYSTRHVAALEYIDRFAGDRPVVVNVSQGMNAGAHDGKSALEVAFDAFTGGGRRPGRVIVKSAGNERGKCGHALVTLSPGSLENLPWNRTSQSADERLELWFSSADEFRFRLFDPAGRSTDWVGADAPDRQGTLGPDSWRMQLTPRHVDNGDSQLLVELRSSGGPILQVGSWRMEIESGKVPEGGVIHAWLERGAPPSSCFTQHASEDMTLSIPGTAQSVIAVGAIAAARPIAVGPFSSYGPTRDGRRKPEVAAPGLGIMAADGGTSDGVRREDGTSMAAPHVTGAIALLLSRRARANAPGLTATQIASALRQKTSNYSGDWDRGQGWGVIDVRGLLDAFP